MTSLRTEQSEVWQSVAFEKDSHVATASCLPTGRLAMTYIIDFQLCGCFFILNFFSTYLMFTLRSFNKNSGQALLSVTIEHAYLSVTYHKKIILLGVEF